MSATRTLFSGGPIHTMAPGGGTVEALLVEDGRIAAVGSRAALEDRANGAARVDLQGATVRPGLIDAHHHFCIAALDRNAVDLHLPPGSRIDDLLERAEGWLSEYPGEGWARLQGWDASKLKEGRGPARHELDEICSDRPLLAAAYSFHEGALNSRGLGEMGWDRSSADPPRGRIGRTRRGELNGHVLEGAFFLAEARSRDAVLESAEDSWLVDCDAHGQNLLASGITRVGDAAVPPAMERLYDRAAEAGRLPVTVHRMPVGSQSFIASRTDAIATGDGPARAPAGAAKLFLDGADACAVCVSKRQLTVATAQTISAAVGGDGLAALRAAARLGGWRHATRDGMFHRGMLLVEPEEVTASIRDAAAHGLQVAQHAIGNEAAALAVGALEREGHRLEDLPGRPRLEHAMLLDDELERRIASSGAITVVQPLWIAEMGDRLSLAPTPPPLRMLGLRSLLDAGVTLAGSSDYPVAGFEVLPAVQAAVTRRTNGGRPFEPDQALSAHEALAAYTRGGAEALGVADEAGTLEVGKRADLVVLGTDPLDADPDRIGRVPVLRTYVDGRLAHRLDPTT